MRVALQLSSLLFVVFVMVGLTSCSSSNNPAATDTVETAVEENSSSRITNSEVPDQNDASEATSDVGEPIAVVNELTSPDKPTEKSDVIEISFDDIDLPIDADMVFRPFMMTERAKSLDGKRVRINGFMLADSKTRGIKQFILVKNTECKFGPGGQADHLVNVDVKIDRGVVHRTDAVSVEGVMTINPFTGVDGNTWSIFDLACERIEKYKPKR